MTISEKGFTLLELLVVGVVISIVLATSVPAIRALFFSDPLRKSTRLAAAFMAESKERALASERGVSVVVDLSAKRFSVVSQSPDDPASNPDMGDSQSIEFSPQLSIVAVWTQPSGRVSRGTVPIHINRRGMIEPVLIDFGYDSRIMRLKGMPFDDSFEVFDQRSSSSITAMLVSAANR